VLLSTNIVEAGLDIPRANTMLIWRADRFGLAQLHQLRGRGGLRGLTWLFTDPDAPPTAAGARRLRTLEAQDRPGAGFAIAARDLDVRGAGDLLGEAQAGHVRMVGLELYQHLLARALAVAEGQKPPPEWTPKLSLGVAAYGPEEYIPDAGLRIDLHS
jgi:transcription-repair coupling factor (superfamily II helicase)